MKRTFFLLLIIAISVNVFAQRNGKRFERIHAIKVSYITDKLKLSSEQAERFWPVYNVYEDEMANMRREFVRKYGVGWANSYLKSESGDSSLEYIDATFDFQQHKLDLNKKYKEKFLKIISPQQLAQLIEAERDFKKMLLKRLQERRSRLDD